MCLALKIATPNKTSHEIAMMLDVSISTIASHRKNNLKKTNTHNVLDLLKLRLEKGWIIREFRVEQVRMC
ncbi:LuxR C-terminal-related transcriptional regulator [Algoriphagus sp. AGSA1]|uniref:LuxR C-terminal-related transcriptional regulator n=1 Tax=Algoriphagus sp. AGSA1 TaxID=2907213 RepID=UPI0034D00245